MEQKKGTFKQIGEGKSTLYAFRATLENDKLIQSIKKQKGNSKTTSEIINELLVIAGKYTTIFR